mmetsp:Transcript_27577/g.40730  ORF Transcript_27577/g.40730 Transcript_27577/m.40730 type:complete len:385 (+) Transcript_27577:245-1399(+)
MGSSRKGKGHQSQNNNANRKWAASSTKQQKDQLEVDVQINYLNQMIKDLEEIAKRNKLFTSWKDVAMAALLLLALGCVSVIIGVAAGMSISIQYFEDSVHNDGVFIRDSGGAYKATSHSSDILARNSMDITSNLHPGRVIKDLSEENRMILSVVPFEQDDTENLIQTSIGAFRDILFTQPSIKPVLCSDGHTMGFTDWHVLRAAIRELNALSVEKFIRWRDYFGDIDPPEFGAFKDDALYYEDETILRICPGVKLKARRRPIFINAENLLIECDGCSIHSRGGHFSFGPHAKSVLIRGIKFQGARRSSLTFPYDGADATFEDCLWINGFGSAKHGPVADVNSTSVVSFHRCSIADTRSPSSGRHFSYGMHNAFSYAVSLRSSAG